MPWKECHVMDERLRFVARLLEGETMEALCEEFGISRKTGHKIYQRYARCSSTQNARASSGIISRFSLAASIPLSRFGGHTGGSCYYFHGSLLVL
jgi:hypothetical protein